MKAVTVRQMPRELARAVDRRARATRTSVNKAVIGLLEEATGLAKKTADRVPHHDLDDLAGSWSRAEATAFDRALAVQRPLDEDLWK